MNDKPASYLHRRSSVKLYWFLLSLSTLVISGNVFSESANAIVCVKYQYVFKMIWNRVLGLCVHISLQYM